MLLQGALKDEVLKIMPVQKQTRAGQRTRFKAFVAIGDHNGHVGLGVKCSKEVATAIRGAIVAAKLSVIPVRRGYWGNKLGKPHTVPCKVSSSLTWCDLINAGVGDRQVRFGCCSSDSSTTRHRHCIGAGAKEAVANGRH